MSASGGGNFYYEDNESYRKYFKPFADKYHFKGAFDGMHHSFDTPNERWGYLATFLHTTQTATLRDPYIDLDAILKGKNFHILTTNQDTQFVKLYPEENVSEIQGDHRFFQCSRQCCDDVWDAVEPVRQMYEAMAGGTFVPDELIPHCPHCGAEAFPWVRGYGNFLQGRKYDHEYQKISNYLVKNKNKRLLFIELGVGRMTPVFCSSSTRDNSKNIRLKQQVSGFSSNKQKDLKKGGMRNVWQKNVKSRKHAGLYQQAA